MKAIPHDARAYKRTPTFTETTVPKGLTRRHATKKDVWGRIVVVEGRLLYRVLEPKLTEEVLTPAQFGVIEPEAPHEVEPLGDVSFYVEFLRRPD